MNHFRENSRLLMISLVLTLLLVGCGSRGAPKPTVSDNPGSLPIAATSAPETAPTAAAAVVNPPTSGAATNVEEAGRAVIQIEAQGSFVDPEFGLQLNAAGRGSGFIIDPSGIAVTNNHVVTGAAVIRVMIPGESRPRSARVLGVSECSDLAVIDIEGDGFPYVDWYRDTTNVGLDIFVAGYPLGDPEYTLTRGIISKANANGRYFPWSSVESVLEYDASTNPGNSGGAVISTNGQVVAVHYAGNSGARQAFGISSNLAMGIVEQLRQGKDVDSIGINGQAVQSGDGRISGIWVASVKSGSPADKAGIRGGDIVTKMEGLVLATDGSMADYCDILRSHSPEATMGIEVLRFATQEVLEGQLNGRQLVVSTSFATQLGGAVGNEPAPGSGGNTGGGGYTYRTVRDDSGLLQLEIPVQWSDVDGSAWVLDNETIGVSLLAAPNLDDFFSRWTTPGVSFRASSELNYTETEVLDLFDYSNECAYDKRYTYSDALYSGYYDVWVNCGGQDVVFVILAAMPQERDFLILVQVQVVTGDDLEALDQILGSFVVLVD
jgi:serine protease Do